MTDVTAHTLQFKKDNQSDSARVSASPCADWDCHQLLSRDVIIVDGAWESALTLPVVFKYPVTLVCHLLTGGPCCFIWPESLQRGTDSRFDDWHKHCLKTNKALVVKIPVGPPQSNLFQEYLLAPLQGKHPSRTDPIPVFGVYEASHEAGHYLLDHVLHKRRLPIVFDLDETLIRARSGSQLHNDVAENKANIKALPLSGLSGPELESQLQALTQETNRLEFDLQMMSSFSENNSITVDNRECLATLQPAIEIDSFGQMTNIQRPVITMHGQGIEFLFTRIKPSDSVTSMVFYIRPKWRLLWNQLIGRVDAAGNPIGNFGVTNPLVDAYVCTAGSKGYPHEAWRVLDPGGHLIPAHHWHRCIIVGRKDKSLAEVLYGELKARTVQPTISQRSPMPFALILEDRDDVWEPSVKSQILLIEPYLPHREYADLALRRLGPDAAPSGLQMGRAGEIILRLRDSILRRIDQMRGLFSEATLNALIDLERPQASYNELVPLAPWVERLLPQLHQEVPMVPQLGPWQPQAAPLPLDPRLHQQQQQQPPQQPPPVRRVRPSSPPPAPIKPDIQMAHEKEENEEEARVKEDAFFNEAWRAAMLKKTDRNVNAADDGVNNGAQMDVGPSAAVRQSKDTHGAHDRADLVPHYDENHPVIVLSKLAQEDGHHLVYEKEAPLDDLGQWRVQVKWGGRDLGWEAANSKEDAKIRAAKKALEKLQGRTGALDAGLGREWGRGRDRDRERGRGRERSRSRERERERDAAQRRDLRKDRTRSRSPEKTDAQREEGKQLAKQRKANRNNVWYIWSRSFPQNLKGVAIKWTTLQKEGAGVQAREHVSVTKGGMAYEAEGCAAKGTWARQEAALKVLEKLGYELV